MTYDVSIIGGGIVGLATAYSILLKKQDIKILLLEKEDQVAKHQTGNNSGVIHSGIYYRPGSLKAQNCMRGYSLLLDFARENNIPFELCGKLIVATEKRELFRMQDLYERGIANGLKGIQKLNPEEVREIEPHVNAVAGLKVPQTGIIDYKEVSKVLLAKIREKGAKVILAEKVVDVRMEKENSIIITEKSEFKSKIIINTAGLYSDRIASLNIKNLDYRIIPFRGEYYKLKDSKKYLVNHLVYPVPDPEFPFLGVHFTRMIDGNIEAGPNAVFAFKREGYNKTSFSFKETYQSLSWRGFQKLMGDHFFMGMGEFYRSWNKNAFTRALSKLVPEITSDDLVPGGAGVRAQACSRSGELIDDFIIVENENILNILNAPSPAATASLAIGESIAIKVLEKI